MYSLVIADDDIIMLGKIAGYLEKKCEDCVVLAKCINGGSALEAVREYSPDLLILDMDMPDMMGTQVIKDLSDEKIMPSTLVLSNYDNYEFVREAMKYGSYDYLLKHQLTEETLRDKILEIRKESEKKEHKENMYQQIRGVALSRMVTDLFLEQSDEDKAKEIENILVDGNPEMGRKYVCSCMRIPDNAGAMQTSLVIDKKKLVRGILSIADTVYGTIGNGVVCHMGRGEFVVLHAYQGDKADAEIEKEVAAYTLTLISNVKKLLAIELPYAIGSVSEEMIESYQLALEKLEEQNLDGLSEYVKDTIAYIDKCYSKDISLETVAKEIHVSPSYLSRLFKREMEMPFTEYLNSFRVKKARQYMEEGEHNLYEISEKTGFNSYNYFLKVYKEYTGLRPSECIQKTK
ncbi:response regulator transcription factor [Butyrivibrio sp. AE3006]|uniref:response regulator transcription factor n=1 Tax=Butyrivibrio sp. AE3006 TaxID=1280673 RepID=UPI00040773B3|nr:helix-turn-helix domain-containing protein [Butyrivibrio sp. AE3006]